MNLGGSWHELPVSAYPFWLTHFRATERSLRVSTEDEPAGQAKRATVHPFSLSRFGAAERRRRGGREKPAPALRNDVSEIVCSSTACKQQQVEGAQ